VAAVSAQPQGAAAITDLVMAGGKPAAVEVRPAASDVKILLSRGNGSRGGNQGRGRLTRL